MSDIDTQDMLLVKQVAAMLRLALSTVYQLIDSGKLSAYKLGGSYRIRKSDVEEFLANNRVGTSSPRQPLGPRNRAVSKTLQELNATKLRQAWQERGISSDGLP